MSSTNDSPSDPVVHTETEKTENIIPHVRSKDTPVSILDLPRELRDIIYRKSIAVGNLVILRVNKLVSEEASQLLLKHAVLRVDLGFVDRTNWVCLDRVPVASVQHVELQLNTGPGALPINEDVIAAFGGNQITRESCEVTLNYGKEGSAPYHVYRHRLYLQLAGLTVFKKLTVKIVVERYEYAEFRGLLSEEAFLRTFPYGTALLSHHRKSYEKVRRFLESSLGPAMFDDSVESHRLEFHPLQPIPDDWSPESEDDDEED